MSLSADYGGLKYSGMMKSICSISIEAPTPAFQTAARHPSAINSEMQEQSRRSGIYILKFTQTQHDMDPAAAVVPQRSAFTCGRDLPLSNSIRCMCD